MTPAFPKLVYVLDENNCLKGGKYDYVTKLAAQCSAKRMYPDYISAKKMRENYEGNVFSCMGCRSFLSPWKDENGEYKWEGRFNQGVVSINLPQIGILAKGNEEKFWKLLDEPVNQNARDKSPAPDLAGEVLRAVLNDTRYPATLLNGVALRIRAEREVTRGRAAILKAYYTKLAESTGHEHPDIPEEVLQVSLNPDATNVSYLLGRLFSVLEAVQAAANPGINATIRDKYFSGASATPAAVFPVLVNLAQKHLKKLNAANRGLSIAYEKQMTELLSSGFTDTFRALYPERTGAYTWWSYRFNARKNNAGWRIDYFIVSDRLLPRVRDNIIHAEVEGSDHCPVELVLD